MLLGLPGVQFGAAAVLPQPKSAPEREVRGHTATPDALKHIKTDKQRLVCVSVKAEYILVSCCDWHGCLLQVTSAPCSSRDQQQKSCIQPPPQEGFPAMWSLPDYANRLFIPEVKSGRYRTLRRPATPLAGIPSLIDGDGRRRRFRAWFTWKDWCWGSFWVVLTLTD